LKQGKHWRQILRENSAVDLRWWEAFYRLEPWGPRQDELRFARLCQLFDNCWMTREKPARLADFMSLDPLELEQLERASTPTEAELASKIDSALSF
jgi:hypothetical protein